jgi:hypothetical protein
VAKEIHFNSTRDDGMMMMMMMMMRRRRRRRRRTARSAKLEFELCNMLGHSTSQIHSIREGKVIVSS